MSMIGSMNYDGLIADLTPKIAVDTAKFKKGKAEVKLKRGSLIGIDSDGNAVLYKKADAENINIYGVLCDDLTVGTEEDVNTPVYIKGCFNEKKISIEEGYALTEEDKSALMGLGLILKTISK